MSCQQLLHECPVSNCSRSVLLDAATGQQCFVLMRIGLFGYRQTQGRLPGSVYCVLCTVYCVLCAVCCVLCSVYCVLCTVGCVLCTVFCVLCTVYCVRGHCNMQHHLGPVSFCFHSDDHSHGTTPPCVVHFHHR